MGSRDLIGKHILSIGICNAVLLIAITNAAGREERVLVRSRITFDLYQLAFRWIALVDVVHRDLIVLRIGKQVSFEIEIVLAPSNLSKTFMRPYSVTQYPPSAYSKYTRS